ncbi:aspartate dehydrogenase [Lacicoccus alkaliphilus]|uniref:L-aspartate dehydrogenase n=1 Tax=Lacicoccus alkaliphilus DSM 16010 TaxID=1123231 RepID=A0A1M7HI07_9BACL|nr:aspartate dehydrogenase [Salinicoccus alkaliphilus]SHM28126.1 aspartate dehydrogenase [Salinicoccus alkaliphilus DSM 16010]
MDIGLIGSGAIGQYLLKKINEDSHPELHIGHILVRNTAKYRHLEGDYGVVLHTDVEAFLASDIDMVVEAANVATVQALLPHVIRKKDTMLISVGALADEQLLVETARLAEAHATRLHLPSGAVGGLDLIQNAKTFGNLERVELTTRKPASSLTGESITEEKTVFHGKAFEAIEKFPKNMNVSIILSLAGLGINETDVRLIADPAIEKNIHEIRLAGDFGEAVLTIKNNPLPENPKTSALAALSILGTLERVPGNIRYGN